MPRTLLDAAAIRALRSSISISNSRIENDMPDYKQSDLARKIEMYVEQMPVPKTPESEEARWKRKAAKFQEEFEKSHTLVIAPSRIRRYCVLRWQGISGMYRVPLQREQEERVHRGTIRPFVENLKRNGARIVGFVRVWVVVEDNAFNTEPREVERWGRLIMAKAHRDARNFHYTKWLMTKDLDATSNDLSGGLKTTR